MIILLRESDFMSSDIIIAIISGMCVAIPNLLAILVSAYHNSKKNNETKNVTFYRLEELERKVDKQCNMIEKYYRLENELKDLKEDFESWKGVK